LIVRSGDPAVTEDPASTGSLAVPLSLAPSYVTRRFLALDHDFAVQTTDPVFGRYLDSLLEPFAAPGEPQHCYSLVDYGEPLEDRYSLHFQGERLLSGSSAASLFHYLLWDINSRVMSESTRYLLVHAAGAELNGHGIIMPAEMESGKTTLVAGLIRAGLRYLTDEAVAIDPVTLLIQPFPKPLTIDQGSWPVLPDLEPTLPPELQMYTSGRWAVDARTVRADVLAPPTRPTFVVSPSYQPDSPTRLIPLRPAETVMVLAKQCFNLALHGQVGLDTLAAIARQSAGYRIEVANLEEACRLIIDLMTATPAGHGNGRLA
jgi:hypothetical protein